MNVRLIAFTRAGVALAQRLAEGLATHGHETEAFGPARLAADAAVRDYGELDAWTARAFGEVEALVFVSACGIAVRAIAAHVRDKFVDPAVVCVDECGRYAIALLSGHVGGANDLARELAALSGGEAVVSTATDLRGCFAVDEKARSLGLAILDRTAAKEVSVALLEGREVGLSSEHPLVGALPAGLAEDQAGERHDLGISISIDAERHPFARTLRLVPRVVTVGVGCKRGSSAEQIGSLVDRCLADAHVAPEAVRTVATIDMKADEEGLCALARQRGWDLRFHAADELARVPGDFSSSAFVWQTVGVDNVCERAACARGERLLSAKRSERGVTVALAVVAHALSLGTRSDGDCSPQPEARRGRSSDGGSALQGHAPESTLAETHPHEARPSQRHAPGGVPPEHVRPANVSRLWCVGLGPGGADDLTQRAKEVLGMVDLIVGYTTYIRLLQDAFPQAELRSTGMRGEVERCRMALAEASAGRSVAVVCSGDPGVYGMASLLFELAGAYPGVQVEVVPGVTAANGGAAELGAPLSHDWCCISLSDLLTPWELIERRLEAAARADFCICLYNPASKGRPDHLRRACDLLLAHRRPDTACGYVRNIGREGQESRVLTLAELRDAEVDMLTCVYVGNSQTRVTCGRLVTPRGYEVEVGAAGRSHDHAPQGSGPSAAPEAASPCAASAEGGSARLATASDARGIAPAVLVFGGTSEGRELVEWLASRASCEVLACTATDYGASLLPEGEHVRVLQGPLTEQEKRALVSGHHVSCIVDATHPYARHISQSIAVLAREQELPLIRITRDEATGEGPWTSVADAREAARLIAGLPGKVLLTTGSKDLPTYVDALPDYRERLYVRVLPVSEALERTRELGIPASHVVAMQGPFPVALNEALLRTLDIDILVTKDSGSAGGFEEKVQAAQACGVHVVVVRRPGGQEGVTLAEAMDLLERSYGV